MKKVFFFGLSMANLLCVLGILLHNSQILPVNLTLFILMSLPTTLISGGVALYAVGWLNKIEDLLRMVINFMFGAMAAMQIHQIIKGMSFPNHIPLLHVNPTLAVSLDSQWKILAIAYMAVLVWNAVATFIIYRKTL